MPDLRPFEGFSRAMVSVERAYSGGLLREFEQIRREWRDAFERFGLSPAFTAAVLRTTEELKSRARQMSLDAGNDVSAHVIQYAKKQRDVLQRAGVDVPPVQVPARAGQALQVLTGSTWVDLIRNQAVIELGRIQASGERDEAVIAGRLFAEDLVDGKASAWRKGRNTLATETLAAVWAAANGMVGGIYTEWQDATGEPFKRQAIAAIDENTTDCCLRVHGQIVGLDEPFHLTGQPRFGPYIQNPPFHWHCRTSQALHTPAMERIGVPTGEMRDAARAERDARARTGKRVEIHPAHATSRRS